MLWFGADMVILVLIIGVWGVFFIADIWRWIVSLATGG
jgi:hypothetical protein